MRQPPPPGPTSPDEPLAVRLRALKDRTGLSLAALAARTPYSKSAWHRYLAGVQRPPRSAVEALARLADADPGPVVALWETGGGPPSPPSPAAPAAAGRLGPPRPRLPRLPRPPLPALALLAVAVATATAFAVSGRQGPQGAQNAMASPRCHAASCRGALPDTSACARDARTESAVSDTGYDVRLRYSPACGTAWSEVRVRSPRPREVSVRVGQDVLSATYSGVDSAGYTSPMLAVPSARGVEACAEVDGRRACTGLGADESAEGADPAAQR
ncbi:helix-turn-helix domain-containing protein [Streptomyces shenzhenensis]|uniref:helix-turn-helix domain-containing protein n=1 Tax=Streptomyces shenzhenensis TaxID=943815 RepID=UPI003405663A